MQTAKFYGLEGGEITSDEWKKLFRMRKRNVKRDLVSGFEVDTIWEGQAVKIEFDKGTPLIYQTRAYLFGTKVEIGRWWWKNRGDALAGHARIVQELGSGAYGPDAIDLHEQII